LRIIRYINGRRVEGGELRRYTLGNSTVQAVIQSVNERRGG